MMKNKKIKDGTKDLVGGSIDPREESVRISLVMEGDLLDAIKRRAAEISNDSGFEVGYQTLMKELLREKLSLKPGASEGSRSLEKRLERLEKVVGLAMRDRKVSMGSRAVVVQARKQSRSKRTS